MKNIRTDMLKESIAEFTNMAQSIKENTSEIVESLLHEATANEFAKILAEDFAKEDEEDETDFEVKDTDSEQETEEDSYESEEEGSDEPDDFESENDFESEDESEENNEEWDEYEDLKVEGEEDTYDFSNEDDETIVNVYKRLTDSDDVIVKYDKENKKVELKDNAAGTEYLIVLDDMVEDEGDCEDGECTFEITSETDENNDINESKMIEIVLTEDNNLGYTTKYQKQDAMTTPPMTEPGKNVNDWDAGVPKGKERPYGTKKAKTTPFTEENDIQEENAPVKNIPEWGTNGKGKFDKTDKIPNYGVNKPASTKKVPAWGTNLSEEDGLGDLGDLEDSSNAPEIEEATNVGGAVQQRSTGSKSHIPSGRKKYGPYPKHNVSADGDYVGDVTINITQESMRRKHNKIMQENKALKQSLKKLTEMMEEARVTNASIGLMNKLMTENTVAQDEKKEIYKQFNEVKTVNEAKDLYKRLNRELKKGSKMNIEEDKQFAVENSKIINENTIYASKDLLTSLDLMHKICK